jgi:glycosyltransferase involved in cell wall biosynthesis
MRIVYYTGACFFDEALSFVRVLSRTNEVHLVLELSPEGWSSSLFDVPPIVLPAGITAADPVIRSYFPSPVAKCWQNTASFSLAVYNHRKSTHPVTWRTSWKIAGYLRSLAPEILHIDHMSLRFAWGTTRLREIRTVLSVHDPESHSGETNWRRQLARRLVFPQAQRFILHSAALSPAFQDRYNIQVDRISVVQLAAYDIFTMWIDKPIREETKSILFFGRLSRYKGLEGLYLAARQVAERIPNVHFTVAGRSARGYCLPAAPTLANGGTIEVTDRYIRNAELARLFQQATLVVCPYDDATQSGVVLTAYAFGKPVVATATGGLPEYVDQGTTGVLVPVRDAPALAGALIRVLEDDVLRHNMRDEIRRKLATQFSWERVAEQTMEVYQKVLS